jgi:predicted N-formylglutamate amidohydrolase
MRHPATSQPEPDACVIVTCEHASNAVPSSHAAHFMHQEALLESHRGWDPGAAELGQALAQATGARFFPSAYTRLLVDLNRSIGHPELHAAVLRRLPVAQRNEIVERFYRPHRGPILDAIARCVARGTFVVHVASHSFTPILHDTVRDADVAWLYAPGRAGDRRIAALWREALREIRPDLRLRRNYPYSGTADGLTSLLRKRFNDGQYAGIELEVNQRFVLEGGTPWTALQEAVITAFVRTLGQLREPGPPGPH